MEPILPGGLYLSFIQCLFENDTEYQNKLDSSLNLTDKSDIKYSSFLTFGQTFYQKYGFKYIPEHKNFQFNTHMESVVNSFHSEWSKLRNTFCEDFDFKILDPEQCKKFSTFVEFIKKIADISGSVSLVVYEQTIKCTIRTLGSKQEIDTNFYKQTAMDFYKQTNSMEFKRRNKK